MPRWRGRALFSPHPWWDPHLAGLGHYDKPPLIYGTAELSFAAFGRERIRRAPALRARHVDDIGGRRLGGGAAARRARRLGRGAGRGHDGASLGHGADAEHRHAAHRLHHAGHCGRGWETRARGGAWRWWLGQVLFWCLALWTKATPALVPLAALSLWVYFVGDRDDRRALRLPLLLPLALVLATPWFLAMIHLHPELKNFYLGREVESRLSGHISGRRGPPYYYLATSFLAWLPWWPFALAAGWRDVIHRGASWRERLRRWGPEAAVAVVGFVVFSLIPSKQHTYVLPLAPWVALLMARALAQKSPRFLWSIAGTVAALYLALVLLAPRFQAHLGRNSSVAPVVKFMRAHGAQGIVSDHFCPGFIFLRRRQRPFRRCAADCGNPG